MTTPSLRAERQLFNQELLQRLRQLRDQFTHGFAGLDTKDLTEVLEQLGIGVPTGDLRLFVWGLLDPLSDRGEHYVPPVVLEVVRGLLIGTTAKVVVDPWARLGELAATTKAASRADHVIAYATPPGSVALGRALAPQLDWRRADFNDPRAFLADVPEQVDLVVCIPPLKKVIGEPIELGGTQSSRPKSRDFGQVMLVASGLRLSSHGRALFVLPASAFSACDSILQHIPALGLGVEAVLELPAGSFAPYANVSANLLVVRKATLSQTFVARLSADPKTNVQILTNLRERRVDGALEMGRLVNLDEFRSIEALRVHEQLAAADREFGARAVCLGEMALRITLGRPGESFAFPAADNAVFVPLVGISDTLTSAEGLRLKAQNYAQIVIDPERSDAKFVAHFLNSTLGRDIREVSKSGSTIPRLNSTGLQALRVFVPPLSVQQRVLDLAARIGAETNTLLSLQGELSDLGRELWASPTQLDQLDQRLSEFSRRVQAGAAIYAAEAHEQWFESLPFPLASILRAWQATASHDYKTKYEHLLRFFEATAEFLSVILLSAYATRPELLGKHKQKIQEIWTRHSLSLERASFGTWRVVVEYLGKQTRLLADSGTEGSEICKGLFADESLTLARVLWSTDVSQVLAATNKMRNDWSGHGGVVGRVEAQLRNESLLSQLHFLRRATASGWSNVQLVRAQGCQPRRGVFDNEVAVMMGSNSEFLTESRSMQTWLDVESLYIVSRTSGQALRLLPLVQVGPVSGSTKSACYFFNRLEKDSVRLVSYHYADQPERLEQSHEIVEAIRTLTE